MTKEQLAKLGIVIEQDEISEEESQKLIAERVAALAGENSKQKTLLSQRNSEIAEYKRKEQEKLSEEEKTKLHYEELEKANKEMHRKLDLNEKVKGYLAIGYSEELATKIAEAELDGKPTFEFHKQHLASREETIKAELLKGTPDPRTDNSNKTLTKADLDKMGYEGLLKVQKENPALYNEWAAEKDAQK